MVRSTNLVVVCDKQTTLSRIFKSEGQENSSKILLSWQELKNRFLSLSLSIDSFWVDKKRDVKES